MKVNQPFRLIDILAIASILGYSQHFSPRPDGMIHCITDPRVVYDLEDLAVKAICLHELEVSLYLISSRDGVHHGTMVEHWSDAV